jgi:hypothetical protein
MTKTKSNLAYIEASANNTDWSEVGELTKIAPTDNGNPVDVTTFLHATNPTYKEFALSAIAEWGLKLDGFWDENNAGQALILANKRSGAALYIKFFYDGTHYMTGAMVCGETVPVPELGAPYVTTSFDLKCAGNMTLGP